MTITVVLVGVILQIVIENDGTRGNTDSVGGGGKSCVIFLVKCSLLCQEKHSKILIKSAVQVLLMYC